MLIAAAIVLLIVTVYLCVQWNRRSPHTFIGALQGVIAGFVVLAIGLDLTNHETSNVVSVSLLTGALVGWFLWRLRQIFHDKQSTGRTIDDIHRKWQRGPWWYF